MPRANAIRHRMVDLDMTQADLARKTGMPASYISHILKTDKDVRETTLLRICKALDCNLEDIILGVK